MSGSHRRQSSLNGESMNTATLARVRRVLPTPCRRPWENVPRRKKAKTRHYAKNVHRPVSAQDSRGHRMRKLLTPTCHTHASELGKSHMKNLLLICGLALETYFAMTSLIGILDRLLVKLPRATCERTVPALVGLQRARPVALLFALATQVNFAFREAFQLVWGVLLFAHRALQLCCAIATHRFASIRLHMMPFLFVVIFLLFGLQTLPTGLCTLCITTRLTHIFLEIVLFLWPCSALSA